MTWRQKLLHTNIYDLLCRMQKNADDQHYESFPCVVGMITGEYPIWRCAEFMSGTHAECEKCIAAFMNEEAK